MFNKNIRFRILEKDNRYERGYMYMIKCLITNERYVGSSIDKGRWSNHKKSAKYQNGDRGNCPLHKHMREFGFENFTFTKIEDWPCDNVWELCRRETYWQVQYNTVNNGLNDRYAQEIPIYKAELEKIMDLINKKALFELSENKRRDHLKNPEKVKEWNKKYYEKNKEEINKKQADKYKTNEEFAQKARDRTKKNTQANPEAKKERDAKYRKDNKSTIKAKQSEKCKCECGGEYTRSNKSRHMKTQEHFDKLQELLNKKEEEDENVAN
jgi:hypothetical protein